MKRYTLEAISQAPVLRRIKGGVEDWEYIGHIPVNPEALPKYYWTWWGHTSLPTPESYSETNEKNFRLYKRVDHLPRGLDDTNPRMATWGEARLQIQDAMYTSISGILSFIRHMKDEGKIEEELARTMNEYVKEHYGALFVAKAKPQPVGAEKLFVESDQAADVKELFRQHMRKLRDVKKATEAVLSELGEEMVEDLDDGPIIYLALAVLQAKKKQMVPEIRARALEIIEKRIGIERWEDAGGDTLKEHLELRDTIKKQIEKVK